MRSDETQHWEFFGERRTCDWNSFGTGRDSVFLIGRNAHDVPLAGALWQVSGGSEERPPLIRSVLSYRFVPYRCNLPLDRLI